MNLDYINMLIGDIVHSFSRHKFFTGINKENIIRVHHMDEGDSRIAVLLPHGVLFRGAAEETIRKYIISSGMEYHAKSYSFWQDCMYC